MGAKVRSEPRTHLLFLDVHYGSRSRQKIYSALPDTKKNREILQAKADQIDREIFLGTFDISRHGTDRGRNARPRRLSGK